MNEGKNQTTGGAFDIAIVEEMNRELRSFLEHSLSSEAFWEKWTAIEFPRERIRCWEIKGCAREDCPSYQDADCRCWLRVGTLCGGQVQGDFAKKYKSCFNCQVLQNLEGDVLRSLYEHINILIHHLKKRDEKIINAAITDQLTGIYNRTYFNEYMEKQLARAGRYKESISFIMADLDGFKGLNDTHGHQAGDAVLKETAILLQGLVRSSDLLFRYGGDEFLIVLPQADCEKAEVVKERIQEAVDFWNRDHRERYGMFRLSLSTGCATWKQGDDLVSRIREADAMMYQDKRQKKAAR